jgi:beta-phosphoglucomutase-like phosphatase (HAD superfamily)
MFDIDGTLTQTDRADELCFVRALREVFGFTSINRDWASYRHCSDSGILEELFRNRLGRSPLAAEISNFQAQFLLLLTAATAAHPFNPVPGAREFVSSLMSSCEFAVSLASGAWEFSARLKLASAGLDFQEIPAAFADTAHAREDIMRASFSRALQSRLHNSFEAVIYVGDAAWDARAARNLGYRFIGIAHEPTRCEKLYAEGASDVFDDYLDASSFVAALRTSTMWPNHAMERTANRRTLHF